MERIIPTHFALVMSNQRILGPWNVPRRAEDFPNVKFVWKIKHTDEPLADRMIKRQIENRITESLWIHSLNI